MSMMRTSNVHFTLYGRGHPVSLVTRDSAHKRSGARPWAQRSRGAGFLPSRALPRVSITPRQLLCHVSKCFKVLILLHFLLCQSCVKLLCQYNFCVKQGEWYGRKDGYKMP